MIKVKPVILCGGSGTRLWPLSRTGYPKQFLCLTGDRSLFQQAALRMEKLSNAEILMESPLIVTGEEHRFLSQEQLREVGIELGAALLEPMSRNTAPALTLAALYSIDQGTDPILVVTPADQTVTGQDEYTHAMRGAIEQAQHGGIVILGIKPDRPEVGYGYIKINKNESQKSVFSVEKFVEKPNIETAKDYLDKGCYYWNAGIFVLKASVWLDALKEFCPDILEAVEKAWKNKTSDAKFIRPDRFDFSSVRSESIDYAVMENCPDNKFEVEMVALDAGWSDLGAWDAVWGSLLKDDHGNVIDGDVLLDGTHNSLVKATSRLVSLVGVNNLVVIETPDAVMVTDKLHSQNVKHVVEVLKKSGRHEHTLHRKVHRPWGWYDSIDEADRFKVKRIWVRPGASLSLQKHHHRAEHWIVVKGTAEITIDNKQMILSENQSTYIPLGAIHRLKNPGILPLEIIEVQSGSYLGEDDIVRYEDTYGRSDFK